MAESKGGELVVDPMSQFKITSLFGQSSDGLAFFSATNSTLWMAIVFVVSVSIFTFGARGRSLVPTRLQSVSEVVYEFVQKMVRDTAGEEGLKYFPYIFTIFIFIFFANMLGLIPGSFTVTSHFAITGALALTIFITVTAIGFMKHGLHFLSFFVPSDAPAAMKPLLALIELISYFVRPLSHSVRLAANMIAGHAILKVFAYFATAIAIYGASAATIPVAFFSTLVMVFMFALEVLVAAVQAYIFAMLTSIYLNDALHMH